MNTVGIFVAVGGLVLLSVVFCLIIHAEILGEGVFRSSDDLDLWDHRDA